MYSILSLLESCSVKLSYESVLWRLKVDFLQEELAFGYWSVSKQVWSSSALGVTSESSTWIALFCFNTGADWVEFVLNYLRLV